LQLASQAFVISLQTYEVSIMKQSESRGESTLVKLVTDQSHAIDCMRLGQSNKEENGEDEYTRNMDSVGHALSCLSRGVTIAKSCMICVATGLDSFK
jgi:hypothetical protein